MTPDVRVVRMVETDKVRIVIDVPFNSYAQALFPNQVLRDTVNDALDIVLSEAANNRR